MRVLMVSTYFHPIVGGAERQALALARTLRQRGHEVMVATCRFKDLPLCDMVDGIPVHRVITPRHRGAVYAASYLSSLLTFLIRRRADYDMIHAHLLFLDALGSTIARVGVRKPVIAKAGCGGAFGDVERLRRVAFGPLFARVLRRVDRIVAPSRQVEAELTEAGFPRERVVRIPNGVDTQRFRPPADRESLRRSLGLQGKVAIFVGRLDPQKGLSSLLEAWGMVIARYPDTTLLVVGQGSQEQALRQLAQRLGIAHRVVFCGKQPEVLPYLQAADVAVLPSVAEGLPNALLEAMACGLACVATRIGGTVDLVTDGENGCLVEPGHPHQLAGALIRLLEAAEWARQLGAQARRTVEAHYTMTSVTDRYLELYGQLLNGH